MTIKEIFIGIARWIEEVFTTVVNYDLTNLTMIVVVGVLCFVFVILPLRLYIIEGLQYRKELKRKAGIVVEETEPMTAGSICGLIFYGCIFGGFVWMIVGGIYTAIMA